MFGVRPVDGMVHLGGSWTLALILTLQLHHRYKDTETHTQV